MPNRPLPDPPACTLPADLVTCANDALLAADHKLRLHADMTTADLRLLISLVCDEGMSTNDMVALDALATAWTILRAPQVEAAVRDRGTEVDGDRLDGYQDLG